MKRADVSVAASAAGDDDDNGNVPGDEEEQLYAGTSYAEETELPSSPSSPQAASHQPKAAAPPIDTSKILGRVENYLLPHVDFYSQLTSANRAKTAANYAAAIADVHSSSALQDYRVPGLCPLMRLDDILYQVALADHIRTMQTMYRDTHDEHRLVADLRVDHPNTTLPTKQLLTKITEGRVRIQALCRLCHGEDSVEMLRATVDLASAYALQGMWQQVSEHMAVASQKLVTVTTPNRREQQVLLAISAREAAAKVECVYRCLRAHAIRNSGQVTRMFLKEIVVELTQILNIVAESSNHEGRVDGVSANQPTQLAALLHGFFIKFTSGASSSGSGVKKGTPSWGYVVDYLRSECVLMRSWVREMEAGILPQNKAVLQLPFRQADKQKRGVAHPQQLAYYLSRMPSAARALAGSTVVKRLQQLKIEVPLLINAHTGDIKFVPQTPQGGPNLATNSREPTQKVLYELPVTLEELWAMHVADLEVDPVDLLRAQVLTLLGVCHIFSNKLALAEENMREALRQLERVGLETEVTACELYNSIAQMMILRYRNWQAQKKVRAKKAALQFIEEEEAGRQQLSEQVNLLRAQTRIKQAGVPTADIVARARASLVAQHAKTILADEEDPTKKAIEAAFRYLVKSYEILVTAHGTIHPSVGTACLAVASVQSIVGNYTVAREWLVRGLRSLEKLDPLPSRAVAFVQTQLSQVLHKQGHLDEALRVLDKAARFHLIQAREKLKSLQVVESGVLVTPHVKRGTSLYDDAMQAIELTSRIVYLSRMSGGKWAAAEQAEVTAELAESTFGWDSAVACEKRKEAADCYAAIADWARSYSSYRRAYDSYEIVYGKADVKTMACAKLIVLAHNELQGGGGPAAAFAAKIGGGPEDGNESEDEQGQVEDEGDFPYSPRGEGKKKSARSQSPTGSDLTLSPVPVGRKKG